MSLNDTIRQMSSSNKGQMSFDQYRHIANVILSKNPCNVLIFGMGQDSDLWHSICKGKALFLENVKPFMESVKQASECSLETLHVNYRTKGFKYLDLLARYNDGDADCLTLDLPKWVRDTKWDVTIVDGPAGYKLKCPSRMKSIYEGFKLGDDVFVHDCERTVESAYCDKFSKGFQLNKTIGYERGGIGELRHYIRS